MVVICITYHIIIHSGSCMFKLHAASRQPLQNRSTFSTHKYWLVVLAHLNLKTTSDHAALQSSSLRVYLKPDVPIQQLHLGLLSGRKDIDQSIAQLLVFFKPFNVMA